MNWISVLAIGLLGTGILAQGADTKKWNTIEFMCGKLIHTKEIPVRGKSGSFTEKNAPIKSARLRLYRRDEAIQCCDGQQPVAETTSSRDGSFQFKKIAPDAYWLFANIEGQDYKLAINYIPGDKRDANCSDILYELKRNELQILRVIQVD